MSSAAELHLVPPPATGLVRVGHHDGPLTWRDPPAVEDDDDEVKGPGHLWASNRFDAPHGEFRTLYFATHRYVAYLEKLEALRAKEHYETKINKTFADLPIASDPDEPYLGPDPDPEHDIPIENDLARVTESFLSKNLLAELDLDPHVRFIDLEHEDTLAVLRERVGAPFLKRFRLLRFDRGVGLLQRRVVTRHLALELYNIVKSDPTIVGLHYKSAHGDGLECWALWERADDAVLNRGTGPIDASDPELRRAAQKLRLKLPVVRYAPLPSNLPTLD